MYSNCINTYSSEAWDQEGASCFHVLEGNTDTVHTLKMATL